MQEILKVGQPDRVAVEIMRYYYKYKCTDIVIDTNGSGIGVFDTLIKPQVDPDIK